MRHLLLSGVAALCTFFVACSGPGGGVEATTTSLTAASTTAAAPTSTAEPATTSKPSTTMAPAVPTVPASVSVTSEAVAEIFPPYDYRTSFDEYVYDYIWLEDGLVVAGPSSGQYVVKFTCGDYWLTLSGFGEEPDETAVILVVEAVAATRACTPSLLIPQQCLGLPDDGVPCHPDDGNGG